jgi:hypothetical protein
MLTSLSLIAKKNLETFWKAACSAVPLVKAEDSNKGQAGGKVCIQKERRKKE